MQIFIRTAAGKEIELAVRRTDLIEDIKAMIQRTEEIPPDRQRLMLGDAELEGNQSLDNYTIPRDCVLDVVILADPSLSCADTAAR
jgi:ubiquitin